MRPEGTVRQMRSEAIIGLAILGVLAVGVVAGRADDTGSGSGPAPSDCVGSATAGEDSGENPSEPAASALETPEEEGASEGEVPLRVTGELKQRGEARRNHDLGSGEADDPRFIGQLVRLRIGGGVGDLRYTVELSDGREFGAERSSGVEQSVNLLQGYLEFGRGVTVRLGRQEITLGRKRLIGASGWGYRNLPAYDGVRLQAGFGHNALDAFLVKVAGGHTAAADDTALAAVSYSWTGIEAWRPSLYAMFSHEDLLEELGATDMPIAGTLGTLELGPALRLDYEAILQWGTRRGLRHRASMYHAALRYTEPGDERYWIAAEYNVASGDDDLFDDESRTFDKLYSINHAYYGFMDYQDPRNMRNLRLTVGGTLAPRLRAQVDYHQLRLDEAADRWYSGAAAVSLVDPTGSAGTDVGSEVDLTANVDIREGIGVEVGYCRFFSGSFVTTLLEGGVADPDFAYVQLKVTF